MTDTAALLAVRDRYIIEERWGADGPGERCLGTDRRLRRTVLLWTVTAPDGDTRRQTLLDVARRSAHLTHPVFLHVVDAVADGESMLVVVEPPSGPLLNAEQFAARGLSARVAADITLQAAGALQEAARLGLWPRSTTLLHLYWDEAGGLRIDPVGLLSGTERRVDGVLVVSLFGLLESLAAAGSDTVLRPFVARWQSRLANPSPNDLDAFVAELKTVATQATPGNAPQHTTASTDDEATRPFAIPKKPPLAAPSPQPARVVPEANVAPTRSRGGIVRAGVLGVVIGAVMLGVAWAAWSSGAAPKETPVAEATQSNSASVAGKAATLTLKASQDARVRVTVDGNEDFSGTLKANETCSWGGDARVQVWSADSKVLEVTVNGHPLGILSAAIGHPEWNTVDWGWPAGWKP